jgi:hypothetical protein
VSPPTGALIAPQNLGTTARARVSWSAATDASGIKSYQLQRRKGTGSWVTVTLPSPTATSVDVPLAPNGSYRFRLRATDNASNTSAWLTVGPKTLGMLQETSTAITYSGTFRRAALTGASGGYVRHASAAGRIAKLTFSGSSVAFVTTLAKARGKAEVWLDGTKVATLDLYAATTQKKRIAWAASLTPGGHTLEIRVLGTKRAAATKATVDVDAFLVWP